MEHLKDIYLELLNWLEYEGRPSEHIRQPLFYTYPWGLRFELGEWGGQDTAEYVQRAESRGMRIWREVFAPEDDVLVIFDTTPDTALKQALKHCQTQRFRAQQPRPIPGKNQSGEGSAYFYRNLYRGTAGDIPFDAILGRIVKEHTLGCGQWRYLCAVYFYNRTKKLLFHPYDGRGADLIGPDRETLRPFYTGLHDLLLDWNREDMDRKWKVHRLQLRILTTTTVPGSEELLRTVLEQRFHGSELTCSPLTPYWKQEGWGELNVTLETSLSTKAVRRRLADHWEGDTASERIRLPNVGFLWLTE